ncbi:MAG: glycosyltransferase family 2 protein [Mariprofundus sp.]|nr:glycosyltransferase family 2 protein [Mariprofundus sp.]
MPDSIAVIISTYNKPDDLRCVLEGYRLQTDQHFSIYVADDGSGEETRTLIDNMRAAYPVPLHHIWHKDDGFRLSEIRNRALLAVSEPYVLITDGDCIPFPALIASHRRLCKRGSFLTGSRLLLNESFSTQVRKQDIELHDLTATATLLSLQRSKSINRIWPAFIPPLTGIENSKLSGLRGCHMSFWLKDLQAINGYDQSFTGWGREDSDITARLFHAGLTRRNLYGTPLLHLWHQEFSRNSLSDNDATLQSCLHEKRVEAVYGLRQLAEKLKIR